MDEATDQSLPRRVGDALREDDSMVAVAESSTGGLISSRLTDVPGSSAYFERSMVTYSNESKVEHLGVDPETITTEGAVSAQTAREMALGIRAVAGTRYGLSTTGVAGPGGGTPKNPVGTIYIGVAKATNGGVDASVNGYEFDGARLENKSSFARQALTDLLEAIESETPE